MCIRDSRHTAQRCHGQHMRGAATGDSGDKRHQHQGASGNGACLLYTSDAADDLLCVDLGGRRSIKKKKIKKKKKKHKTNT